MENYLIQVLLIDDHAHIHDSVSILLRSVRDIQLVAHAADGKEGLLLCEKHHPDVVLIDIVMPGMNGFSTAQIIRKQYPEIKLLVLTSYQDEQSIQAMFTAGVNGYILKEDLSRHLVDVIRTIAAGQTVISTTVAATLLNPTTSSERKTFGLTERELEVLHEVATGKGNLEVADALSISRSTVKFHILNIQEKLGVQSRGEMIALAVTHQLV